jgi:ATP-dependent helicase/nuclease subunit A
MAQRNGAGVNAELLELDAQARRRALQPASFIVEAPAGAGKTELLTQRYLMLLAHVDEPEEIVAITFTNKAAAEMRNRILESLELAASGVMPPAAHKQVTFELGQAALAAAERRNWSLLQHPGRLRVTTIDAFCTGLARQMPLLSQFGSQPRLTDDAGRHYDEAARRTLAWLDEDGPQSDLVAAALARFDNDAGRVADLLADMLARRDQWLRHAFVDGGRGDAEAGLEALVMRDLQLAAQAVPGPTQATLMPVARYAAANLADDHALAVLRDWSRPLRPVADDMARWHGLATLLLTDDDAPRRRVTVQLGFPPKVSDSQKQILAEITSGLTPGAVAALAQVRCLPVPRYADEEWLIVEALAGLLRLAAAELWSIFQETGEADFIELAQRARMALGSDDSPTDLALSLDYRIRHLLVDEFQDTSPTQVELLQRLTAGWSGDDGRSLFLVGDPMQSIYRFRKADVGLFLEIAANGLGTVPLQRLSLRRNNRSCPAVVDWINLAFAGVFPSQDNVAAGAIAYRPFAAAREPAAEAGVMLHPVVVGEDQDADEAEAQAVISVIDAERRSGSGREISVLVRARDHLSALVTAIRRRRPDLRFQAVEIEGLAQRQVVQDLLALTRALYQFADRVCWLAVLRAPWCGLSLSDLEALAGDDHGAALWTLMRDDARLARLSADGRRRVEHVRAVLAASLEHAGRSRPRRWIEGTWMELGGPACLESDAAAADANSFLDLIDKLDAAGRFDMTQLEREMARLYAAPDPLADGSLQFMTLHKAKGLEFDAVVLLGLNRATSGGGQALMLWEEVMTDGLREHLVVAPLRRRRDGTPSPYDYLAGLERRRAANEAARVLYVGATRAVRHLHLIGAVERNAKGEVKPKAGSFLKLLWPQVGAAFEAAVDRPHGAAMFSPGEFVAPLLRLASVPAAAQAPVPTDLGSVAAAPADEPNLAADLGTLVHSYLEMAARDGPAAWPQTRLQALRPAMAVWLGQRGHEPEACGAAAKEAAVMLATALDSADGRWLLAQHEGAGAEVALAQAAAEGSAVRVVDRSFVADGARWIVDYKTAESSADPAAQAERYRDQLSAYAALYAGEGRPLRLGIFFVRIGRLVEIPA